MSMSDPSHVGFQGSPSRTLNKTRVSNISMPFRSRMSISHKRTQNYFSCSDPGLTLGCPHGRLSSLIDWRFPLQSGPLFIGDTTCFEEPSLASRKYEAESVTGVSTAHGHENSQSAASFAFAVSDIL